MFLGKNDQLVVRQPADRSPALFVPEAHLPRLNRGMASLGVCNIAGIRLARERQVNVRVKSTRQAIEESVILRFKTGCSGKFLREFAVTSDNGWKPQAFEMTLFADERRSLLFVSP